MIHLNRKIRSHFADRKVSLNLIWSVSGEPEFPFCGKFRHFRFFQFSTEMKSQEDKKIFIKIIFLAESFLLVQINKTVSSVFWVTNSSERQCRKTSGRTISET